MDVTQFQNELHEAIKSYTHACMYVCTHLQFMCLLKFHRNLPFSQQTYHVLNNIGTACKRERDRERLSPRNIKY